MSDFSLINEVLRNPEALVQDETLWHVTRLKQAIEQIPQDYFSEKFAPTVKKPSQLRVSLCDWAKRQNGRLCGDEANESAPAAPPSRPSTAQHRPASPPRAQSRAEDAAPARNSHPSHSTIAFGSAPSAPAPPSARGPVQPAHARIEEEASMNASNVVPGYHKPQVEDEPAHEDVPVVRNQYAPHAHEEEVHDRYAMLKSRRDALIVRVYDAKREIASIQAEMDSLM